MPSKLEESSGFVLLGEKTLPQTADADLLAYCPSMDLVALGSTDRQVLIYRLNGQRVYGATQKAGTLRVEAISWKPNGQLLAIAWSDGSIRLVGAESSKIVHQFSTGTLVKGITCLGWTSNLANKKSVSGQKSSQTWQGLLSEDLRYSKERTPLDLPRDLSLIDIEISLPKLSVLAAGGSSEEVFSSRSSLDALFTPFDPKDNDAVDVMVVGTKEGNIHLSIYDSFVIGSFEAPVKIHGATSHLVLHAAHQQYSTHSLLMKLSSGGNGLYFVPMDLRFVSASSPYLSLLASRSTALQNLLRYIHQVQILMISEWKAAQELPSKFLRNINETLAENGNRNIVEALYHSVATGHTFPVVREWLVDELTERGHKRWDKAVSSGLENLKRLVHENMLPALDRCSVILSRFTGIAKFQGDNDTVGFSSHQITLIMDTVACLHLVSSRILMRVVDELDLFTAFSSWLRYEIDRLASESSSSPNEESLDKEASIDHNKVLLYLQTAMTSSPLEVFLGDSTEEDIADWPRQEHGLPMFDLLDKQLEKQEQGLPYTKPLARVELLCKYLTRQATMVFSQLAEAEKRNVLFGKAYELGAAQSGTPNDMKTIPMEHDLCYTYVAFVPEDSHNKVQIFRMALSIESGISTVRSIESCTVQLGKGDILDLKFVDDNTLFVLWNSKGVTSMLNIAFRGSEINNSDYLNLTFSAQTPKAVAQNATVISDEEVLQHLSIHQFPNSGTFVPRTMDVRERGSKGSNDDTRRIVLLGHDSLHYSVFKMPPNLRMGQSDNDVSMS